MQDKAAIRRPDRGVDPNACSSQFKAAAVEMCVLRRLLAHGEFIGANRVCPMCAEAVRLVNADGL